MLPLASKTSPTLKGASSLENCVIVCSAFSSKSLKCSFSNPVTNRFIGSVTVTLIRTSCVSTRMLVSRRVAGSSGSLEGLYLGSGTTRTWLELPPEFG